MCSTFITRAVSSYFCDIFCARVKATSWADQRLFSTMEFYWRSVSVSFTPEAGTESTQPSLAVIICVRKPRSPRVPRWKRIEVRRILLVESCSRRRRNEQTFAGAKKVADDIRRGGDFALEAGIYKSQVGLKFWLVHGYDLRLLAICGSSDAGESIEWFICSEPVIVRLFASRLVCHIVF